MESAFHLVRRQSPGQKCIDRKSKTDMAIAMVAFRTADELLSAAVASLGEQTIAA